MNKEISGLVKSDINLHGELHLDAERTAALVSWLEKVEEALAEYAKRTKDLADLLRNMGP